MDAEIALRSSWREVDYVSCGNLASWGDEPSGFGRSLVIRSSGAAGDIVLPVRPSLTLHEVTRAGIVVKIL